MHQLIIETLSDQYGRETFSRMVQRYGFEQVSVERVDSPNGSPIYRITINIPTTEKH